MSIDPTITRLPPHDLDAEQALLGSLLLGGDLMDKIAPRVRPADFYRLSHGAIWCAMLRVHGRGEPVDAVTVFREVERQGLAETTGGRDALAQLVGLVTSPAHAEHYAEIVREKALARELIHATSEIQRAAYAEQGRGDELVTLAEARVQAVADAFAPPIAADALKETVAEAVGVLCDARPEGLGGGLSLGLSPLDRLGMRIGQGDFVVLSAGTGGGKSVLAMQIGLGIAERLGQPVVYVTLEMTAAQLLTRALVARSGVRDPHGQGLGALERAAVESAGREISALPFLVPYPIPQALDQFLLWLTAYCRRAKPALVIIDHIGLLQVDRRDLYTQTTLVSQSLRQWALRGGQVPILALVQLRRRDTQPNGSTRPPELHDLKDSGSLENDATCVLMLDSPYQRASTTERLSGRLDSEELWLHVKKNRSGVVHVGVPLCFDGAHYRIQERDTQHSKAAS